MRFSMHGWFEPGPIADAPTIRLPEVSQDESDADIVSLPDDSIDELPETVTEAEQPAPRPELAFDVVLPPNIGEGRFVPQEAVVYKKDSEGRPVLVDGRPIIESITYLHPHLDFSKPPTREFFASLREFSPFHARSLLSEVHYSTFDAPMAGKVPLPRQVRLHGRLFTFDRHLGGGGTGEVVLYRDEENRPIVMKLLSRPDRGAQGMVRALEEASVHALVRPVALDGESSSLLSKAMRMTDVTRLSTIARDFYSAEDWRAMDPQKRERAGEELRDLAVGFVDAVMLVPDGKVENSLVCAFLPYEEQGSLQDTLGQQRAALRSDALTRIQFQELRERIFTDRVEDAFRMAQSLNLVHALGVTHRDVKPGNFFRGADGKLRLADFGLARKEAVRTLRGLDRALKSVHEQLANDAEGLYLLAMGAQEKTAALTDEQAVQVWNWLRDFVAYQTDPELSVHERLALMKDLISRLAFREGSLSGGVLSGQGAGAWKPSRWERRQLEQVEEFIQSEPSLADEESEHSVSSDLDTDELLAQEAAPTFAGSVMGTPRFVAPEAARGESGKRRRGPKEDVFAFGVILHGMFSMGRVRGGDDIRDMIDQRAFEPDAGIEFFEKILSQEERARVIDSVAEQKNDLLERSGAPEDVAISLTYEQQRRMEIHALIAMPGLSRMVGLAKWCTMRQPDDRPTDKEVIEVLTLVRAQERARERASI